MNLPSPADAGMGLLLVAVVVSLYLISVGIWSML
jgi:hypothetical protein